jgi:hypothetical protein
MEKLHGTKLNAPKQPGDALQKLRIGVHQCQMSLQWRHKERDGCQVVFWLLRVEFIGVEDEFKVFQMLKKTDEVYDLSVGPDRPSQGEGSKSR